MIKFFRKIRQGLLNENSFSKYLLYAFGEIVLVAIGILIALWVNDWNENRKDNILENKYLRSMLEDYEDNLAKSTEIIERIEFFLPQLTTLLEQSALERPTISLDSINMAFSKMTNMPSYSSTDRTYNNLMGSGDLKLIKNDKLKTNLAEYYKELYILNLVQETHELQLVQSFQPYIVEYLDFQAVRSPRLDNFALPEAVEHDKILEVMGARKFRNVITLKCSILKDLLAINRNLAQINRAIVDQLKLLTK